jgi:RNA polymerase sigma-70 factor (ECF subfamily)
MNCETIFLSETMTKHLVEQTARGDQRAFEELCRAYEKPLFHAALRVVGDHDLAREVMQDVLLAIWEGAKNFKGDSKPFTWMWAIVRHKATDALRTRLRSRPGSLTEGCLNDDVLKEQPAVHAVICEALGKLSPEQRLVVILTYYFNFSQYHIGRIMQCPVGTVKSRLSAALRQLREVWIAPLRLERLRAIPYHDDL